MRLGRPPQARGVSPQPEPPGAGRKPLSPARRIVFATILGAFPLCLLLLVEGGLRLAGFGQAFPLFVDALHFGREYRVVNPMYGKKYFMGEFFTSPANDMFLKAKPANGFRVFVLGSSTAFGFPYGPGVMFSRILGKRLQDSYPNLHVEVVNTAITAVNSFTFANRIDEVLRQAPDAILIYAGHNEFYGALGIGSEVGLGSHRLPKRLHLFMLDFRTYQALYQLINRLRGGGVDFTSRRFHESATLMERIVRNRDIEYQGRIYRLAHAHYRANMGLVLRRAKREGVPVFFSEVVSNVRDLPPFGSPRAKGMPLAIEVYREAQRLDSAGHHARAREHYIRAKDLDGVRFRASSEINRIIHALSARHGAHLVPMVEAFQAQSPQGIIGHHLITEHVHPNVDGYFLMADAFYRVMVGSGVMGPLDSAWYKPSAHYRQTWGFTTLDSHYAHLLLRQLMGGWPFTPDTLVNRFIYEFQPETLLDTLAFNALLGQDFSLEEAHLRMAMHYKLSLQPYQAAQEHRAITRINPWGLQSFIQAGNLYMAAGEHGRALDVFLESLRITRENLALHRIGELYYLLGQYEAGLRYFRELRERNPHFNGYRVLGFLHQGYRATGRGEQAERALRERAAHDRAKDTGPVAHIMPSAVKELVDQAIAYLRAGNLDRGKQLLLQANGLRESNLANRMLGEILYMRNDPRALGYFRRAYFDLRGDPEFLHSFAVACVRFGDRPFARRILDDMRQAAPDGPATQWLERTLYGQAPARAAAR